MADLDRSVVGMAHPAHAPFEVKLLGMNGNEIKTFTFEELQWYTVGALVYDMENDNEPGIDGAQADDEGRFMESFHLVDGVRRMHEDRDVLDYFYRDIVTGDQPPAGPFRMTLVKEPIDEATRLQSMRRKSTREENCLSSIAKRYRFLKRRLDELSEQHDRAAKRLKVVAAPSEIPSSV